MPSLLFHLRQLYLRLERFQSYASILSFVPARLHSWLFHCGMSFFRVILCFFKKECNVLILTWITNPSPMISRYCHKHLSGYSSTMAKISTWCCSKIPTRFVPTFLGVKSWVCLYCCTRRWTVLFVTNGYATLRYKPLSHFSDCPPAWYAATILCRKSKECVGIFLSSHFNGSYPIITKKTVL